MNIEIINVGTELLLGEIINTNATYLQKMCKDLGFNVYYQTVVGDNVNRLKDCLEIAFNRGANCVITTGGLGPTKDDLTKELSAEYLGLEMIYDEKEAKLVNDKCCFVTGKDEVPQNNFKQAYFPKDCYILNNEVGTANGCVMKKDEKMIVNLPGPPKEMKYVVDHELVKYLSKYQQDTIYTQDIVTMGIGESMVDEVLNDIILNQKDVTIALYASEECVRIRLGTKAKSQEEANCKMAKTHQEISLKLNDYIVENKDIRDILEGILPPTKINNKTSIELTNKLNFKNKGDDLIITLVEHSHPLGAIINVQFKYKNKETSFDVPLLKDPNLSINKLEAKIINQLYLFIR